MRLGSQPSQQPSLYLPERAGWTQGQGREVIRQGVVVNDGPPRTVGLQPPAALCALRPAQKGWWGGRLTFRPGTRLQGCPQKKKAVLRRRSFGFSCIPLTHTSAALSNGHGSPTLSKSPNPKAAPGEFEDWGVNTNQESPFGLSRRWSFPELFSFYFFLSNLFTASLHNRLS